MHHWVHERLLHHAWSRLERHRMMLKPWHAPHLRLDHELLMLRWVLHSWHESSWSVLISRNEIVEVRGLVIDSLLGMLMFSLLGCRVWLSSIESSSLPIRMGARVLKIWRCLMLRLGMSQSRPQFQELRLVGLQFLNFFLQHFLALPSNEKTWLSLVLICCFLFWCQVSIK